MRYDPLLSQDISGMKGPLIQCSDRGKGKALFFNRKVECLSAQIRERERKSAKVCFLFDIYSMNKENCIFENMDDTVL